MLAALVASIPERRAELSQVLSRSKDATIAKQAGLWRGSSFQSGTLSSRELEVLDFIRVGMTNKAIASALFIEVSTVKAHIAHIFVKLGLHNRAEAAVRYAEIAAANDGGV